MRNRAEHDAPLKWKKFHLLVDWGLRSEQDLEASIHRYKIRDYRACCQDIYDDMAHSSEACTYIIKLVYQEHFLKLPNYIIKTKEDYQRVLCALDAKDLTEFCEIWYCKNSTDCGKAVFGRLLFSLDAFFPRISAQRLEMTYAASARSLEMFPHMQGSFLAFERDTWNTPFAMKEKIIKSEQEDEVMDDAQSIIAHLASAQKQIVEFGMFIKTCGCLHLSIEFSLIKDKFRTIDWDSDNDARILRML